MKTSPPRPALRSAHGPPLLLAVALALAGGAGCAPSRAPTPPAPAGTGAAASLAVRGAGGIDLTLRSLENATLELSSLRGRVVIVDVWATWCGPCRRALPGLVRLSKSRPDDLVIVGLSADRDRRALASFLRDNPLPYFIALADRESLSTFRANVLPTHFVLDREGKLRETLIGGVPESELLSAASRYF